MKKTITLLFFAFISLGLAAQLGLPVTFENALEDTAWVQIANAGDDPANMSQVENPAKDGINTSDSCLMLIVQNGADLWVGAYSEAYGEMVLTSDHHIMEMMIYKDKISKAGVKFEGGSGELTQVEKSDVYNTKVNEWELLTFDLSAGVGNTFPRLTIFVDWPEGNRTSGGTVYIDNIQHVGGWTFVREAFGAEINVYPNPTADVLTVKYPEIRSITISNVVGQRIRSVELFQVDFTRLDVSDLNPGVYFLSVDSPKGTVSSKFIKE